MDGIVTKLRDLCGDLLDTTGRDAFEYISLASSKVFTLSTANAVASTIKCYKNGTLWSSSNYTYDADIASATVTGTLVAGDVLIFTYSFYNKYSDSELEGFCRSAIYHLDANQYGSFVVGTGNIVTPTPTSPQESLIAVVASILMKGNVKQYRTPEITIVFNDSTMTVDQKIKAVVRQYSKAYGNIIYVDREYTYEEYVGEE